MFYVSDTLTPYKVMYLSSIFQQANYILLGPLTLAIILIFAKHARKKIRKLMTLSIVPVKVCAPQYLEQDQSCAVHCVTPETLSNFLLISQS